MWVTCLYPLSVLSMPWYPSCEFSNACCCSLVSRSILSRSFDKPSLCSSSKVRKASNFCWICKNYHIVYQIMTALSGKNYGKCKGNEDGNGNERQITKNKTDIILQMLYKFQFYGSVHHISINENTNLMQQS